MEREDVKGIVTTCNLKMIYDLFKFQNDKLGKPSFSFDVGQVYEFTSIKFRQVYLNLIEMMVLKHFVSSFEVKDIISDSSSLLRSDFINHYPDIGDGFESLRMKVDYFMESTFYNPISSIVYVVDFEFTGQKVLNLFTYNGWNILKSIYESKLFSTEFVSNTMKDLFVKTFNKVCNDYHTQNDIGTYISYHESIYKYMGNPLNPYKLDSNDFYRMCIVMPKDSDLSLNFNTLNPKELSKVLEKLVRTEIDIPTIDNYYFIFSLRTNLQLFMAMYLYSDVVINHKPLTDVMKRLSKLPKEDIKENKESSNITNLSITSCLNALRVADDAKDQPSDYEKIMLLPGYTMIDYTIKIPVTVDTELEQTTITNPINDWILSNNEIYYAFGERKLNMLKRTIEGVLSCL